MIHGTEDAQGEAWRGGGPGRPSSVAGWSCSRGPGTPPTPATRSRSTRWWPSSPGSGGTGPRVRRRPATRTWTRALRRPRRALYLSSPIGLGHARRDLAIARELRRQVPGLEIDWLAQDPVTRVLEAEGERIHPASAWLANESAHIERESAEHDLHAFQAIRRMDEILVANFMVFHDVVREQPYDLWVGDEAWELDYFLHENPEEKRAAYVLADRLRGLAAHARRGRARGVPDRRLQRRDDRAHRPLPAAARPGGVRRQPRRHRARPVRPRAAGDPGVGRGPLRLLRATSPGSTRPALATATSSAAASATGPTSRSAWSRSAGRGSAATCCGA